MLYDHYLSISMFLSRISKSLFLFFLLFISLQRLHAQDNDSLPDFTASDAVNTDERTAVDVSDNDYSKVDAYALSIKKRYKKTGELAHDLTAPYKTDEDKVRSIFIWITNNIAYDCAAFHSKKNQNIKFTYKNQADLDAKREKFYADYAARILRSRKAICEGYAVLFQELCKQSGIRCEIAVGKVSNNTSAIERVRNKKNFSTNHAWDRVLVSGTWYYIDPTWASGYCDKNVKKFYKSFKPYYYLTPIDKLYVTHAENEKQTVKRNNAIAKVR